VNVLVFFIFQELELWGSAESPECLLGSDGCLYFRETCVGTSSKQSYTIIGLVFKNLQMNICCPIFKAFILLVDGFQVRNK
jgi:hypothetical protein